MNSKSCRWQTFFSLMKKMISTWSIGPIGPYVRNVQRLRSDGCCCCWLLPSRRQRRSSINPPPKILLWSWWARPPLPWSAFLACPPSPGLSLALWVPLGLRRVLLNKSVSVVSDRDSDKEELHRGSVLRGALMGDVCYDRMLLQSETGFYSQLKVHFFSTDMLLSCTRDWIDDVSFISLHYL